MRIQLFLLSLVAMSIIVQGSIHTIGRERPSNVAQDSTNPPGLLYVSPSNTTNEIIGSKLTIYVQVSGMQTFNGWDIFIKTNSSIISPIAASDMGDWFESPNYTGSSPLTPLATCINGAGMSCNPSLNGPGVVELSATVFGNVSAPSITGNLFSITYNVTSSTGYSQIQILNETNTFSNGSRTAVPFTFQNGIYGKPANPDFTVTVNPGSVKIVAGMSATATIQITSTLHLTGMVGLAASVSSQGGTSGGITFAFGNQTLQLKPDGTNNTRITLVTTKSTPATSYTVFINATAQNSILRSTIFTLTVVLPDSFLIGVNPGAIMIHEGNNGTAQILLESYGFNGTVDLTVRTFSVETLGVLVPKSLTYSLLDQNLTLQAGPSPFTPRQFTTNITVTTSLTSLPFKYQLNINATYGSMVSQGSLTVVPPPASLSVTLNPTTISVRAGQLSSTTITVQSVDYFWGFLSASAIMSGATVNFNSSIYYIAPAKSANVSYVPWQSIGMSVNVTNSTPPGNYVALLTVYSLATTYQKAFSTQVEVQVVIEPGLGVVAGRVFGIPSNWYYAILAALAVPLILLSLMTYMRREKDDEHDWRS